MNLAQKVVLVTGAGRRVGRAIALRLAGEKARIAVHCNTSRDAAEKTAADCRAAGGEAVVFQADLANAAATGKLMADVIGRFGGVDVLVNNASIFEPMSIDQFELSAWERTFRINLTAPMQLVHAAAKSLRERRGRVVNFGDVSVRRPWPDHLAYMASKGGLETLTFALARALAPEVNVVGVAPGVAAWPDDYDEDTRERLLRRVPLRRAGSPDDMAAAVHYFLTGGDYVTGVMLPVDGGRSIV